MRPAEAHPPPTPPAGLLLVSDDESLAPRLQACTLAIDRRSLRGDGPVPLRAHRHAVALVDLRRDAERGLALIEGLRHCHPSLPLLALLPRGDADLPLRATSAGAGDFCLGGDDAVELTVRLRRLVLPRAGPGTLVVGDLEWQPASGQLRRNGRLLDLPRRQQELLQVLMRHAGEVLSRERIEAELALVPGERRSNLVEVHVHHLRRRLGASRLLTLRGQGYRLVADGPVADATERTLRE